MVKNIKVIFIVQLDTRRNQTHFTLIFIQIFVIELKLSAEVIYSPNTITIKSL